MSPAMFWGPNQGCAGLPPGLHSRVTPGRAQGPLVPGIELGLATWQTPIFNPYNEPLYYPGHIFCLYKVLCISTHLSIHLMLRDVVLISPISPEDRANLERSSISSLCATCLSPELVPTLFSDNKGQR